MKTCAPCQWAWHLPPTSPLHPWEWPAHPWACLNPDYGEPFIRANVFDFGGCAF